MISRTYLKRLLAATAILVVLWLIASYVVASVALKRRHARFEESAPSLSWGKAESLRLTTSDDEELGAWFIDGRSDQPVVVLLHGHNGCRGNCLPQAEIFASAGCPVLLVSLRAHGDSTGEVNDVGYSAREDVVAAVAWLEKHHAGRRIVIYGQSMGSAAALFASEQLGKRVHGYILESPYKDLRTAVWNRSKFYLPVVVDVVAYAGLVSVSPLVLPDLNDICPLDAAAGIPNNVPVLVLAGGADQRATPEEANEICQRIRGRSELVVIEGADHGRLLAADPVSYRAAVSRFVNNR